MKGNRVAEADAKGFLNIADQVRGKKSQLFKLDPKTKTIVSQQWTDKSININHNGKAPDVQL